MAEFFPIRKKNMHKFIHMYIYQVPHVNILLCMYCFAKKEGPVFVRDCLADKERDPDS